MPLINADKPHLWKDDVERSIDFYNDWFVKFAPETFRNQRARTTVMVETALAATDYLRNLSAETLTQNPGILPVLRMTTAPPLARDRLIGLAHASKTLVETMEGKGEMAPRLPPRIARGRLMEELSRIADLLAEMADRDLFPWLQAGNSPDSGQIERSALVVADRVCGAASDPIIRNAQERRQLAALRRWLSRRGYCFAEAGSISGFTNLPPGWFTFRLNIPAGDVGAPVSIPVDCVIQPTWATPGSLPLLIEAKSAGDFTNTNKRRKEEAQKLRQLRERYGGAVRYLLLLCGYFGPDYLGYEAAEGFDWVWEHRLGELGLALANPNAPPTPDSLLVREDEPLPVVCGTELTRMQRQREIDATRSSTERNRLGQFATPLSLATAITARAISYLPPDVPISMIEPACGTGAFFSALRTAVGHGRVTRCCGVELDPSFAAASRELWQHDGVEIHEADFMDFTSAEEQRGRFNLLCANPPYVRHHHLAADRKRALQSRIASELGLRMSGLSGLYVYFTLLADPILEPGAVAAWLIPSEFLVVNYGAPLREYLRTRVTLLELFQFDPEEVQFDDALVSSCVLIYRKTPPPADHTALFRYGTNLEEGGKEQRVPIRELAAQSRWHVSPSVAADALSTQPLTIADLFTVRRGIATGANDFFVLTRDNCMARELSAKALRPVLTSPKQLPEDVIESDEDGIPRVPDPRFLLDCPLRPSEVARLHPATWAYIEHGREQGVAEGYLCRSREPWYAQEQRPPARFLVSYMGRSTLNRDAPFRFFLNRSQATATNGFLCLYPKPVLERALAGHPEREIELLQLLNGIDAATLRRNGRSYGGGLHKVEPSELLSLPLPKLPDWFATEPPDTQLSLRFALG